MCHCGKLNANATTSQTVILLHLMPKPMLFGHRQIQGTKHGSQTVFPIMKIHLVENRAFSFIGMSVLLSLKEAVTD